MTGKKAIKVLKQMFLTFKLNMRDNRKKSVFKHDNCQSNNC